MIIDVNKKSLTGYIDTTYRDRNVRLYGELVSINESNKTATMRFDNGVVENGIPLEAIQLDEGAVDWVKKNLETLGNKASQKFKIVAGYCRTLWNGVVMPIINSIMIGQMANKKLLPAAVGFYPSDDAKQEASEMGININDVPAELDEDGKDINQFWRNIIDRVNGTANESGTAATLEDVKREYLVEVKTLENGDKIAEGLQNSRSFNRFFTSDFLMENYFGKETWNKLLEYESGDKKAGLQSYKSENIPEMSQSDIVRQVMTQLKMAFNEGEFDWNDTDLVDNLYNTFINTFYDQIKAEDENLSDEEIENRAVEMAQKQVAEVKRRGSIKGVRPMMIWGAPGIGKTSIIQQTRSMFAEATGGRKHINMLEVVLSKMEHDDFALSTNKGVGPSGEARAAAAPVSWLPIWQITGDPEEDARRNHAANMMGNRRENFDFDVVKDNKVMLKNDNIDTMKDSLDSLPEDIPAKGKPNSKVLSKINGETYWYQPDGNVRLKPVRVRKKNNAPVEESYVREILKNEISYSKMFEARSFRSFSGDTAAAEQAKKNIVTDGGIIFFDELTRAKKGVMSVIMNLINDRKFGEGWVLGSHWIIVCAGNRFYEMPGIENTWEEAFGTRFIQMTYVPKFEDWVKWAQGYEIDPATGEWKTKKTSAQKIDQDIIDFLLSRKVPRGSHNQAWYELRDDENVDTDKASKIYANPRSWETASNLIYDMAVQANGGADKASTFMPRGEYYNLPLSQKLKALSQTIGMGNATYGGFADYHDSTKFFNPGMIDSIWKFGTITGKKSTGQMDYKELVPRDPRTGKPAGISDDLLEKYAMEVLGSCPKDWKDVTTQDLINVLSYFISILKVRHGDDQIIMNVILKRIGQLMKDTGADKAKGFTYGDPDDPAFCKFIDPIVDLVFAFQLPGHIDTDTSSKEKAEEFVEYVDKVKDDDKLDNLTEEL